MTPLEELRSIGSFSGAMFKVLEDFDARLKAVESHGPTLSQMKSWTEELLLNTAATRPQLTEQPLEPEPAALPDAATPDSVGSGVEPLDVPGGITTSIKGISIK